MGKSTPSNTLRPFVKDLEVGEAITHENLVLLPLRGGTNGKVEYILCEDALADGTIQITEVSEHGSVPQLLVVSVAETMILLLDGEELVGAKQNRILNTTVLLPAKANTKIPVSCVEAGRWHHISVQFASGGYAPARLRAQKSRDVGENLRQRGIAQSDQSAVWDEVAENMECLSACSPTMAMHDAVNQRRGSLDEYIESLPYSENARGVAAVIGGRFAVLDLFDKPETLELVWARLVTGYAMDAIGRPEIKTNGDAGEQVKSLLKELQKVECQPCPSVGVGEDWRFENDGIVGQALVAEGACVHLSVFPNDAAGKQNDRSSRIMPPSRRRRHRSEGDPIN